MNQIIQTLQSIKKEHRLGLMTHIVLGYPEMTTAQEIVRCMIDERVDFLELQIPFSDPLGDGATIREANAHALSRGFRVRDAFAFVHQLTKTDSLTPPIFFMTYFNIVYRYGVERFCEAAAKAGVAGLIIPDYTAEAEDHERLYDISSRYHLLCIPFIGPDSDDDYVSSLKPEQGFAYCFARRGVTGARTKIDQNFVSHLQKIHDVAPLPLAVGFGISEVEHLQALHGVADIAIVGSAVLALYETQGLSGVRNKVRELLSTTYLTLSV